MSLLPYAEQLRKTVIIPGRKKCKNFHFADAGKVLIPFCSKKWFGEECKREERE